ncbi:predicted protein [Histoplasma capsulatum var. duboisii H88]|uniref:Predicted protein n=1 Tax=Ajellomyces capsulatus (strain H88) TaxID=544711 RepID=F0U5E3_AJEC8|nr:predicted protein [Histoplasma capsulatum var. duboisii H88]
MEKEPRRWKDEAENGGWANWQPFVALGGWRLIRCSWLDQNGGWRIVRYLTKTGRASFVEPGQRELPKVTPRRMLALGCQALSTRKKKGKRKPKPKKRGRKKRKRLGRDYGACEWITRPAKELWLHRTI